MSSDVVTKKRGRPKKVGHEDSTIVLVGSNTISSDSKPTQRHASSAKVKAQKPIKKVSKKLKTETNEERIFASDNGVHNSSVHENVSNTNPLLSGEEVSPIPIEATTTSQALESGRIKSSVNDSQTQTDIQSAVSASPKSSISEILRRANAFATTSRELNDQAVTYLSDHQQSQVPDTNPSIPTRSNTPMTNDSTIHDRQGEIQRAEGVGRSKFLDSFFNDKEPTPVSEDIVSENGPVRDLPELLKQSRKTTTKPKISPAPPPVTPKPVEQTAPIKKPEAKSSNTVFRLAAVKPTSFATQKNASTVSSDSNSQPIAKIANTVFRLAAVKSSSFMLQKNMSTASSSTSNTTSTKPGSEGEITQLPPAAQLAASTLQSEIPQARPSPSQPVLGTVVSSASMSAAATQQPASNKTPTTTSSTAAKAPITTSSPPEQTQAHPKQPLPASITAARNPSPATAAPPPPPVHPARQPFKFRGSTLPTTKPKAPPPRRPTQLTFQELRANKEYRRLAARWTGVIVGIPVLIWTSWELYTRYDKMQVQRREQVGRFGRLENGGV